MIKKILKSISN